MLTLNIRMGNNYCETFWNKFLRNDRNEYENIYLKLKTTLYLMHKNILMLNHITSYTKIVSKSLRYPLELIYYNGNWQFILNLRTIRSISAKSCGFSRST